MNINIKNISPIFSEKNFAVKPRFVNGNTELQSKQKRLFVVGLENPTCFSNQSQTLIATQYNQFSPAKEYHPQTKSCSAVSPAFFHPAFCGNPLAKKFSKMLNEAIATSSQIKLSSDEIKKAILSC